jgi:hypothetical protein
MRLSILALVLLAIAAPSAVAKTHRLPAGYHWGRCLLIVRGQTRISGSCGYQINKGGAFQVNGPHQIYEGIDFPVAEYGYQQQSNDYWADVWQESDGTWMGYGNSDIRGTHGDYPWEKLRREGACYVNSDVRICLWRK